MATRYGRRSSTGIYEYHHSLEALTEAQEKEARETRITIFGTIGLVLGGILVYVAMRKLGGADWPKLIKFAGVIVGAAVGALTLIRFADLIWKIIGAITFLLILYGVFKLIYSVL